MRPIKARMLPHTVTLFNLTADADGNAQFCRTILERVRVDSHNISAVVGNVADKTAVGMYVYIDPMTTIGYDGDTGEGKGFLTPREWAALDLEDKPDFWTLQEQDWLCYSLGEIESIAPAVEKALAAVEDGGEGLTEDEYRHAYGVRVISGLNPVIDKDGTVHHWEANLD